MINATRTLHFCVMCTMRLFDHVLYHDATSFVIYGPSKRWTLCLEGELRSVRSVTFQICESGPFSLVRSLTCTVIVVFGRF